MIEPSTSTPSRAWTVVLMLLGILMLFPGACALVFIAGGIAEGNRLSFDDPIAVMVVSVWVISFLISLGGVLIIRAARRRARAAT